MIRIITLLFLLIYSSILAAKPLEIVFWHSMAGHLGEEVDLIVKGFNQSQTEYLIKPVYKGEYTDSLTSFAAAFRAKQPPGIVQVFEVGTSTMLYPRGIIKPLYQLTQEYGISLPTANFLPALLSFYSAAGKLQAMPFNTSVPVIFYNKNALAEVGLNENSFPKTWQGMGELAAKLKKAGYACGYTTSYPAWIHIESFSALHGLPIVDRTKTKATYNNPAIIHHLERLRDWQARHYFEYGGRASDATILFTSGRCVMFSQSSGSYQSLAALVNFDLGVAALPLDNTVTKVRKNNVIGGAALWAVSGQTPQAYRGIARFYAYLSQPAVQQSWYQQTGYIPLGISGQFASLAQDSQQPTLAIAKTDLASEELSQNVIAEIPQNQIRIINDEALEAIFSGIKSPLDAMNDAVVRADFTLLRFKRNTSSLVSEPRP